MERPKINQQINPNPMPEFHLFTPWQTIKAIGASVVDALTSETDRDRKLAEKMMDNPEAQEAFEQLRIEYDSSWDVT